jgi:hypothetical protein
MTNLDLVLMENRNPFVERFAVDVRELEKHFSHPGASVAWSSNAGFRNLSRFAAGREHLAA